MIINRTALSKSNPSAKPHKYSLDTVTGQGSCTCPGWCKRVVNGVRDCTHLQALRAEHGVEGVKAAPTTERPKASPAAANSARLSPMLASAMPEGKTVADYVGNGWVLERKYDGHRVLLERSETGITAWSRPRAGGEPLTRTLPAHILKVASGLPHGAYDGEILLPGGTSSDVTRVDVQDKLMLVLFDILSVFGTDVKSKPQHERRAMLVLAVQHCTGKAVTVAESQPVSLDAIQAIWNAGGEGAILKRVNGVYRPGYRTADWVKVKKVASATLQIIGFKPGKLGPHSTILLRDQHGIETSVKTLNNDWLRLFAADADSYIGRLLVISYNIKTADGKYRHPMADHIL